jgi:hypothetical protein
MRFLVTPAVLISLHAANRGPFGWTVRIMQSARVPLDLLIAPCENAPPQMHSRQHMSGVLLGGRAV